MISAQTIDKVKDLAILDVIQKYYLGNIKRAGANYSCECPFHKDSRPSLMISPSKNIARCFACDTTTTGINYVMHVKSLTYPDAIRQIARDFNINIVETQKKEVSKEDEEKFKEMEALVIANSWATDWYHGQLLSLIEKHFPDNQVQEEKIYASPFFVDKEKQTIAYIIDRFKGSIDLLKKFRIGYAPEGFDNLYQAAVKAGFKPDTLIKAGLIINKDDKIRDYFLFRPLIIPIHSSKGNIVGFTARQMPWNSKSKDGKEYPKYINTAETLIFKKGSVLFGLDNESQGAIRKADKVYLVEGNLDKTGMFHIGVKNVLTKSGTALSDDQIVIILKLTKNVCLLDDGDNAGQLSMIKNGEKLILAGANVTVITLPDKQDPDSFFTSQEQFKDYEKETERDYIVDVRAINDIENANTIHLKKKAKQGIAEMLIIKPRDERDEYINQIIKNTKTNKSEWYEAIKLVSMRQKNKGLNITEEDEAEVIETDQSPDNREKHNFYFIKKNKEDKPDGIEIDPLKFLLKLKSTRTWEFERNERTIIIYFGFFTYSLSVDENEMIYVQLREGRIKKVSVNYIKRIFFQYIRLLKPYSHSGRDKNGYEWDEIVTSKTLESKLIKNTILFEEKRLILFPDKRIELLQDTIDKHYTFFKNCYVISTKDGYKWFDYETLKDGYVWDDAVLDRDFTEPIDNNPGVFEKFVHDISGNEWNLDKNASLYPERIRYRSLLVAGGYMLHNYTEMQRKAVILTQGRISEDDTAEGREGKTLFIESIGRNMLNKHPDESKTYVYVPGKDLKADDKHKWMDLELNTTCVLYDDPPPYIQFEDLYNLAERAFKVEKKRQENIYVKARIFITTNRPLERDSGSSKARSCVIELDSIYHSEFSPVDKYGHYFFRDWTGENQEEWNKFSKYVMGTMLPEYFKANCTLLEPPSKNLYRNELLQKARRLSGNADIIFWLDTMVKGSAIDVPYFKLSETYRAKELYEKLLFDSSHYSDNKKLKTNFSKIVKAYFEKEGISFISDRDSSGSTFQITGGLKTYTQLNRELVEEFFSNGSGFTILDVDDNSLLPEMVKAFNKKFNANATIQQIKKAVDEIIEINQDSIENLPF